MVTEATNMEEQLVSMKATLNRLVKKSVEKHTQIKYWNNQIVELMKKLEKKSFEASNKSLYDKDFDAESNQNKEFDKEYIPKKDCALGLMSAK